ncbi:MAG TPA: metallophosphoesterase family protein [Tepidisphaeraceae bacterium]|jgi:hypothetical protein|nr:metallophosphoesterase family protein [Tepidisphaeraceae bacterium]
MIFPSRRGFLAASVGALAAAPLFAADQTIALASNPSNNPGGDDFTFAPTTLFLTWQSDPTTTMTIQWIGAVGEASDTKIAYAPLTSGSSATTQPATSPKSIWLTQSPLLRPFPFSDLKLFRAELTGLSPGVNYQFRIGHDSPTYRFRTMPAKLTDAFHFISGGDSGANIHAVNNNIQAARQDPQFALIGGDLAYENGKSVATTLAFIRNYSRTMIAKDGRMIPMIACIGNHEVDGGYDKPRAKAPFFYALFDGLFKDTSYTALDFGDYLSLILLDTGHNSPIGGEQTSWLEKTLKARVDHPHVFAVNHVPAYPSNRKMEAIPTTQPGEQPKGGTGVGNRKYWTPLFDKYRLPVVLEHHDHTFKRTKPLIDGMVNADGVIYLGDGSWGKLRAPQSPQKLHFLANASRDYHLSLHCLQGEERFHLALDEFGRVMDVGHSGQRKLGVVAMPS